MNIAVVDVAAESSGALSVLNGFMDALYSYENKRQIEWFVYTSVVKINETGTIHNINCSEIKKSWISRLYWEYERFPKECKKNKIDIILSLQNNALPVKNVTQIVYFHNVLLTQQQLHFSFFDKEERIFAIYTKVLAPYIRRTWKKAKVIIVQGESVKESVSKYYKGKIVVVRPNHLSEVKGKAKNHIRGYIYPATPIIYKNFECIVNAVKKLSQKGYFPEIYFTITGKENAYARRIKEMSQGLSNIYYIGYQKKEDILEKYVECGLVTTSQLESFSVPLLEARDTGTVIAALYKPYVRDFINETNYNRLHLAKEEDRMADILLEGLQDFNKSNYAFSEKTENSMKKIIDIIVNQCV